jgi:hypothetical protein
MKTTTLSLAAFGFFNSHNSISVDQIRGQPMDEEIKKMQESAADLDRASEKVPSGGDSAGERLKQAVKRKTGAKAAAPTVKPPKAMTREQHQQYVERERARYRHKPRKQTKGE